MSGVSFDGFKRVRFENARFAYDAGSPLIFRDMTFDVPLGRNVFVTGEPGGGQSTFLKLISVLAQPQAGRFFINEYDTMEMSFEEFLPIRMKIGYSFDYGGLFANRTLRENLTLPLLYHKICSDHEANKVASDLAEEFRFADQQQQRPAMVSGGLRKLVCVLRAFMLRPEMIVFDDPFTGIGADASRKLIRLIREREASGELKHVFLTSRDEFWPHEMGCDSLVITRKSIRFDERKAA